MGQKRQLGMLWGIMLVGVCLLAIQTEAYGQSWKWELFLEDTDCNFYYDPDAVSRSPGNIVRVWWKEVFKTKDVLKSRGFTKKEYEKTAYQINVTEIDCKKKQSLRKFFMLCSEEGDNILCAIHRRNMDRWVPVTTGHPTGALFWKLCQ